MNSATVLSTDQTPLPSINFPSDSDGPPPGAAEHVVCAIEAMPQLMRQIIRLWNTRELNTLIHKVLLDSRDGQRQGFPHEVAKELMFLAKLNVLARAHEAAPLLGIAIGEACNLIEKGDHAALGYSGQAVDLWGAGERSRSAGPTAKAEAPTSKLHRPHERHGKHARPAPPALAPMLRGTPPIPPSACLDLTSSRTLRHDKANARPDDGDVMDQGFYRCIAKELGSLKIPQLVLSDLGHARRCSWLASAVSFAKNRCHFKTVVLHVDPLSAQVAQLLQAMTAGLDLLVIDVNLASGKWRAQAEARTESDPEHFRDLVRRLVHGRDQLAAKTGRGCRIGVRLINHKSVFHLSRDFIRLSREPGLEPYRHLAEEQAAANAGSCHCWSPFIEAHIRTNGHLVACAQDHSGYSFTADLKQVSFSDAWQGPVFRGIRERVLDGDKPGKLCEICPHLAAGSDRGP